MRALTCSVLPVFLLLPYLQEPEAIILSGKPVTFEYDDVRDTTLSSAGMIELGGTVDGTILRVMFTSDGTKPIAPEYIVFAFGAVREINSSLNRWSSLTPEVVFRADDGRPVRLTGKYYTELAKTKSGIEQREYVAVTVHGSQVIAFSRASKLLVAVGTERFEWDAQDQSTLKTFAEFLRSLNPNYDKSGTR